MIDLIWPAIRKVDDGGYQVFLYIASYIPLAFTLAPGILAWILAAIPRDRQDCISSIGGCCTSAKSGKTDIENSQSKIRTITFTKTTTFK